MAPQVSIPPASMDAFFAGLDPDQIWHDNWLLG
jgi:hypothetical protein